VGVDVLEAVVLDGRLDSRVGRRARRHVLVDRRSLVVPADTHTSVSGHDNTVVHTENAASASLGSQLRLALRSIFSRDNKLNEKRVCHLNTFQRLSIASVLELLGVRLVLVGEVVEFQLNIAISASEVRLPAIVEVLLAQNADLLTGEALLLGILGGSWSVSLASRGLRLDSLLESPGNLLESPEVNSLGFLVAAHKAIQSQADGVGASGVDNVVVVSAGLDVGGREDADRVVRNFVFGERSLHRDSSLESDRCDRAAGGVNTLCHVGVGLELIRDSNNGSIHGSGKVAIEEDGEREWVTTLSESGRLGQELPALEFGVLVLAVCAVALVGPLLGNVELEGSSKASDLNNLVLDIQKHLSSDESTSALLGVAVEDYWWALDAPVDGNIRWVILMGLAERQRNAVMLLNSISEFSHLDSVDLRTVLAV